MNYFIAIGLFVSFIISILLRNWEWYFISNAITSGFIGSAIAIILRTKHSDKLIAEHESYIEYLRKHINFLQGHCESLIVLNREILDENAKKLFDKATKIETENA